MLQYHFVCYKAFILRTKYWTIRTGLVVRARQLLRNLGIGRTFEVETQDGITILNIHLAAGKRGCGMGTLIMVEAREHQFTPIAQERTFPAKRQGIAAQGCEADRGITELHINAYCPSFMRLNPCCAVMAR